MQKLPKITQKSPYITNEKAGKRAFCDGSHKNL